MLCPGRDSQLIPKSPSAKYGLSLHYLYCPNCRGHWLSAFDANYISSLDLADTIPATKGSAFCDYASINSKPGSGLWEKKGQTPATHLDDSGPTLKNLTHGDLPGSGLRAPQDLTPFHCPQCLRGLFQIHEESIPPDVAVFRCPDAHGYFFPAGELVKFKKAQETKLAYHKAWKVPLPSVATVLLVTVCGIFLSTGLIVGVVNDQSRQNIKTQAQDVIASQKVYTDAIHHAATIVALTTERVALTVIVDGKEHIMLAPDGRSHVFRLTGLTPGTHRYYFTFQKELILLRTPEYTFSF